MNEYLVVSFVGSTMTADVKIVSSDYDPHTFAEKWYEDKSVLRVYALAPLYKIGRDQFGRMH